MLLDTAAKIENETDPDCLWQAAREGLGTAGIDHMVYITVGNDFSDLFVRTTVKELYHERPPREDPFLRYCCESYEVILAGAAFVDRHPYISPEERAFIERAATFGFNAALAIPMRLMGADRFGGFIIGNGQSAVDFQRTIVPRTEELRLFCMIVHRRLEELIPRADRPARTERPALVARALPAAFDQLTPRETEVILMLAQGKTRAQSARICGISIHTLSDYAKQGYRKLGVTSAAAAAALLLEEAGGLPGVAPSGRRSP
ncbi:autoinducer binding domain-containing protein [Sulfitobacter albidus]|uniref:Autoinducer binding domain-containing protein n=1 Tax=Sulfitobacter albidus TaxID=2829501 RepID=A0A975JCD9_9RHOB|nr:LuxR family transcriptional regulator [Sulfitobacter albidus]QUJ75762.1 autoinducer binding domain-containing protein [Sulfitobacter albidus]